MVGLSDEVAIVRLAGHVLAVAELVEPGGMCLAPGRASENLSDREYRAESRRNVAAALFASAQRTDAASRW